MEGTLMGEDVPKESKDQMFCERDSPPLAQGIEHSEEIETENGNEEEYSLSTPDTTSEESKDTSDGSSLHMDEMPEDFSEGDGGPSTGYLRTQNEMDIMSIQQTIELPFEHVPPEYELKAIGVFHALVEEKLLIIQSYEGQGSPLDFDSVLAIEDGRLAIGVVMDIFGPVKAPFYSVLLHDKVIAQLQTLCPGGPFRRSNDTQDDKRDTSTEPWVIYYVPNISQCAKIDSSKGCDASNLFDEECSDQAEMDFSDDEHEKSAKLALRRKKQSRGTQGAVASDMQFASMQALPSSTDNTAPHDGAAEAQSIPCHSATQKESPSVRDDYSPLSRPPIAHAPLTHAPPSESDDDYYRLLSESKNIPSSRAKEPILSTSKDPFSPLPDVDLF